MGYMGSYCNVPKAIFYLLKRKYWVLHERKGFRGCVGVVRDSGGVPTQDSIGVGFSNSQVSQRQTAGSLGKNSCFPSQEGYNA